MLRKLNYRYVLQSHWKICQASHYRCLRDGRRLPRSCKIVQVKRTTACGIVRRWRQTGAVERPRGGFREQRKKIDEEMKTTAVTIVEDHPAFTLDELHQSLRDKSRISLTSLVNILDGQFISLKKLEDAPTDRNRLNVKEERREFALWLTSEGINKNLVYVEENGFNLFTRRTKGRARVGQRVVRQVLNSRGKA